MLTHTDTYDSPIRLRVRYRNTEGLLSELTRVLGVGRVSLESSSFAAPGTRFVFQLETQDAPEQIFVQAQVEEVSARSLGQFQLGIRYEPQLGDRDALQCLLRRRSAAQPSKVRRHPRLPINLQVPSHDEAGGSYLIRDLSRGGIRIEARGARCHGLEPGAPFLFELKLTDGALRLHGQVKWVLPAGGGEAASVQFGAAFGKLRAQTLRSLDEMLTLQTLPVCPWEARLSFGPAAVERMPGSD